MRGTTRECPWTSLLYTQWEKIRKIRRRDVASPSHCAAKSSFLGRKYGAFAKNYSQNFVFTSHREKFTKIFFVNFSFFGRKYGRKPKNSKKFASATSTSDRRRKCAGDSPAKMRRKNELFATANNFSHLRKIFRKHGEFWVHLRSILRKWTQNSPCFRNFFFSNFLRKIILICAGDPPSQCDANTKNSEKFASATAMRRRRRKRVANTAKTRRKREF